MVCLRRVWGVFAPFLLAALCACGSRGCGREPAAEGQKSSLPKEIAYVGRFDLGDSARFAWSGSTIRVRFEGASSIAVRLKVASPGYGFNPPELAYAIRVDDRPKAALAVNPGEARYELAHGLDPSTPHEIALTREAEAFAGIDALLAVELPEGGRFLPVPPRRHRLEVVGDSISAGYGILGANAQCRFSFATERASITYGALLGQALDADVTIVAWSGKGMLRNFDGTTEDTMPELFERTLPTEPTSTWKFGSPADAVIVNLGTNDWFGGGGRPLEIRAFEDTYVRFLHRVREVHPRAFVFVVSSPMLEDQMTPSGPGTASELSRKSLQRVVERRRAEGETRIEFVDLEPQGPNVGCDSHPNAESHRRMAARLEPSLRAQLDR
ncbi:Endoglucanase E precursor [Labilithrix luteola]|uniref:Endoglucanase E n=2 Tax=Labilithrix luteola TaxID=1391654 RepID=A0A0K1Q1F5_9BACT|nr:Endoglucanase E precursor [Labilithrix luteola]